MFLHCDLQVAGSGDESHLTVSDIGAKLVREDDIIGRVTPLPGALQMSQKEGERKHS